MGGPCELPAPNPVTLSSLTALWGVPRGHSGYLPSHPGLARVQDPRLGRCGARKAQAPWWSSDTRTWAGIPMGEPPHVAPSCQLTGQAPALQSCQLSQGAYASPAVPSGASAFVPSCRGGRQSPQLRAEHPSKHQSPSVLPAKFHRLDCELLCWYLAAPSPAQSYQGLLRQGGEKVRCTHAILVLGLFFRWDKPNPP